MTELNQLGPRCREVALLLTEHLSTSEICRRTGMGHGTVKVHLGAIYRVLGVKKRAEAVDRIRAILNISARDNASGGVEMKRAAGVLEAPSAALTTKREGGASHG